MLLGSASGSRLHGALRPNEFSYRRKDSVRHTRRNSLLSHNPSTAELAATVVRPGRRSVVLGSVESLTLSTHARPTYGILMQQVAASGYPKNAQPQLEVTALRSLRPVTREPSAKGYGRTRRQFGCIRRAAEIYALTIAQERRPERSL